MDMEQAKTVQHMLNGEGFDLEEWIDKARRELERLKKAENPLIITDHAVNAAITISSLCDWTYNFEVPGAIPGKEKAFADDLAAACPDWRPFHDMANTAKHANRKNGNEHVDQFLTIPFRAENPSVEFDGYDMTQGVWYHGPKSWYFCVPVLVINGEQIYFLRRAEQVLAWWSDGRWRAVAEAHAARLAERAANRPA